MKNTAKPIIPKGWRPVPVGSKIKTGDRRAWNDEVGGTIRDFFKTSCAGFRILKHRLYIRRVE